MSEKYCVDCKYHRGCGHTYEHLCTAFPRHDVTVNGDTRSVTVVCAYARYDESLCGDDAKAYKQSFFSKLKEWFNASYYS